MSILTELTSLEQIVALKQGRIDVGFGRIRHEALAALPLVVYPKAPRPSFADQAIGLFRQHGLRPPAIHEVRELQTALGLVAAETGACLVPASVERPPTRQRALPAPRRPDAVSPIIMSTRKDAPSPELRLILKLIK